MKLKVEAEIGPIKEPMTVKRKGSESGEKTQAADRKRI